MRESNLDLQERSTYAVKKDLSAVGKPSGERGSLSCATIRKLRSQKARYGELKRPNGTGTNYQRQRTRLEGKKTGQQRDLLEKRNLRPRS